MSAFDKQVGGNHYKNFAIEPAEFLIRNNIKFGHACAIKYLMRHTVTKNDEDLHKAIHYIELILECKEKDAQESQKKNYDDTLFCEDSTQCPHPTEEEELEEIRREKAKYCNVCPRCTTINLDRRHNRCGKCGYVPGSSMGFVAGRDNTESSD